MWDSNQQEILLFLIVFPKLFSLNTFEEIHCQNILFWFCFSLILSPCFWVNISAWPTFFFLLKMWVQFLMYDACQHVDMLHQTLYLKQKYWVVKILECICLLKPWFLNFFVKINEANNSTLSQVYNSRNNEKSIYLGQGWVWCGCGFSLKMATVAQVE